MKTNIYILLILLLSFSFANAQDKVITVETRNIVPVSDNNENITVGNTSVEIVIKKETTNVKTVKVKEAVAKCYSDIRVYLNRTRKVENIKWLFPKINKPKVA